MISLWVFCQQQRLNSILHYSIAFSTLKFKPQSYEKVCNCHSLIALNNIQWSLSFVYKKKYIKWLILVKNSQIAHFRKLYCNLSLFRKYIGIYQFLDTRVWWSQIFHSTQVYGTRESWKNFKFFLWYLSFINSSIIENFQNFLKYIFQTTQVFGIRISQQT